MTWTLALNQPALAAALRARGLARAAQFNWQRTARETMAVYERVLAGRGAEVRRQRSEVRNQRSAAGRLTN